VLRYLREVRVPISAVDSISPGIQHTKQQLFRPFRFGQWARLALVGLCAGELGSGGGGNFNYNPNTLHRHDLLAIPHIDPALLIPLVIIAVIAIPVLWLLVIYVSSRMRFVGVPALIAFLLGWFTQPREHLPGLILGGALALSDLQAMPE
jgi:hypothetical protein